MLALADIGAQMMVMGPKHAAWLGVKEAEYLSTKITIKVADNWTTRVLGMAVTEGTDQLYLCSFYTKLFKLDRKIESKYTSSTSTPACVPSHKKGEQRRLAPISPSHAYFVSRVKFTLSS